MRLQWRYNIINLFIICFMAMFFIIDDIKLRRDRMEGQMKDISMGVLIRDVADALRNRATNITDPKEMEEALKDEVSKINQWFEDVGNRIFDVNVTDEQGRIIASLKGFEVGNIVNIDRVGYKEVYEGQIRIYRQARYHGKWVTEAIISYPRSEHYVDETTRIIRRGLVQILFESPEIANYLSELRIIHMIYVAITSISFLFLINFLTNRMVIRPLESLVDIIQRADEGDTSIPFTSDLRGEIGRVSIALVNMIRRIKNAHHEKIEALGRMASGVAHEIRNPLNTIGMTTQYLKALMNNGRLSDQEIKDARECLTVIEKQVAALSEITEQFLTLNRPVEITLTPTDLDKLTEDVLSEFSVAFNQSGITVVRNYCRRLVDVPVDSGKMRQAIYNLIQNAIQAMPKGGKIFVTTRREEGRFLDRAVIEIRDTGSGIPEHIQGRIFDAYFTTREKEGGLGLGLSVTHQIVEAHDGKIELRSKEGMGASFTITIPIKPENSA